MLVDDLAGRLEVGHLAVARVSREPPLYRVEDCHNQPRTRKHHQLHCFLHEAPLTFVVADLQSISGERSLRIGLSCR